MVAQRFNAGYASHLNPEPFRDDTNPAQVDLAGPIAQNSLALISKPCHDLLRVGVTPFDEIEQAQLSAHAITAKYRGQMRAGVFYLPELTSSFHLLRTRNIANASHLCTGSAVWLFANVGLRSAPKGTSL